MIMRERLLELLRYDRENGTFYWKAKRRGVKRGEIAGTLNDGGYWQINVDGRCYRVHRLVWLVETGNWPSTIGLDHIDRDRLNNRFSNLREATHSQNAGNMKSWSSSGLKGVTWDKSKSKWMAQIRAGGISYNLGRFYSKEDAHAAYISAAQKYHGQFAFIPGPGA